MDLRDVNQENVLRLEKRENHGQLDPKKLLKGSLHIGCSFKFFLKIGVELIVNSSRISYLNLTSLFALFVVLFCRRTSGAFSTPILRINLN
jgi:E3 ubiquitin-protein ligase DOA10